VFSVQYAGRAVSERGHHDCGARERPRQCGAQRYKLTAKLAGSDSNPWLAVYDLETDDPMSFLGALGEAASAGKLTQSDSSDMATTCSALFEEYGERVLPRA
jgi:hypothetical protein